MGRTTVELYDRTKPDTYRWSTRESARSIAHSIRKPSGSGLGGPEWLFLIE